MKTAGLVFTCALLAACSHSDRKPVPHAADVNLDRFMGRWYVIANIPTFIEKGAHNAIESYEMNEDGTIATTFTFHADDYDGKLKTYTPVGFVSDNDNSLWGMQFIWPFRAEFIIAYLDENYQHTIIARNARDYVWIMARTPEIDDSTYQGLINFTAEMGYDSSLVRKVPQRWSSASQDSGENIK